MSTRRVDVIEDDAAVRKALVRVLHCAGFDAQGYESAVDYLLAERDDAPSCLVLDVALPGMTGPELQVALGRRADAPQIVFVTGRGDVETGVCAMKRGAVDFLTKPVRTGALLAAVETALARDASSRGGQDEIRSLRERYTRLTPREREVYASVTRGLLNKQIASALGTSTRTVKAHRAQVMAKMEVRSVAALVRAAARLDDAGNR
jgi:FixJ family two-component response regulator